MKFSQDISADKENSMFSFFFFYFHELSKMTPKEEIEQLRAQLHQHNYNYYVLKQPTISDYEFDQMMHKLEDLETFYPQYADPNSPTQRVGSDINQSFRQVPHKYPMLSLANTYNEADVRDF